MIINQFRRNFNEKAKQAQTIIILKKRHKHASVTLKV